MLFIKKENLNKVQKDGLFGTPDIVIEILSPSSSKMDYKEKKSVYEKFAVSEYFLVDPESKSVDSFFLKEGKFEEQKKLNGIINSRILGKKVCF